MSTISTQSVKPAGVIFTILGVALFSTLELASKKLGDVTSAAGLAHINGYALVAMRFLLAGVLLTALGYKDFRRRGGTLTRQDWKIFVLNGVFGVAFSISLFHFSVDAFKNASSAAVVFSANALFTIILARFVNGEPWTLRKWLAMLFGMCGIGCFLFESGSINSQVIAALSLMMISAIAFSYSVCLVRKHVAKYGATFFMGVSSIIGGLAVVPIACCTSSAGFWQSCQAGWLPLLYILLPGTALAYWLYYLGLQRVTAFMASMLFLLKPVLACVWGTTLRGEMMNRYTLSGAVIIVAALIFAAWRPRKS